MFRPRASGMPRYVAVGVFIGLVVGFVPPMCAARGAADYWETVLRLSEPLGPAAVALGGVLGFIVPRRVARARAARSGDDSSAA